MSTTPTWTVRQASSGSTLIFFAAKDRDADGPARKCADHLVQPGLHRRAFEAPPAENIERAKAAAQADADRKNTNPTNQ